MCQMKVGAGSKSEGWLSGVSAKLRFSFSPSLLTRFGKAHSVQSVRGAVALVLTKPHVTVCIVQTGSFTPQASSHVPPAYP